MTSFIEIAICILIGAILGLVIPEFFEVDDRSICEKPLPRTEKCVKVWVPEVKKQ